MARFTFNGKTVTNPLGKAAMVAAMILTPVLIVAYFVFFISSMWNHDVTALLIIAAVGVTLRILNLRKKPVRINLTLGSLVRFAGGILFLSGLWFHAVWMIVLGLILMVKIALSK